MKPKAALKSANLKVRVMASRPSSVDQAGTPARASVRAGPVSRSSMGTSGLEVVRIVGREGRSDLRRVLFDLVGGLGLRLLGRRGRRRLGGLAGLGAARSADGAGFGARRRLGRG